MNSVVVHLDARSQFVAFAAGAIVGRCGASSAVRFLTQASAAHIGRDWIVFPARQLVACAQINQRNARGTYQASVPVPVAISATLGVVASDRLTQGSGCLHFVEGGDTPVGFVGRLDRFLVVRKITDAGSGESKIVVVDTWAYGHPVVGEVSSKLCRYDQAILHGTKWLMIVTEEYLILWCIDVPGLESVRDALLPSEAAQCVNCVTTDDVPTTMPLETIVGDVIPVDDNTLAMMRPLWDSLLFVDLEASHTARKMCYSKSFCDLMLTALETPWSWHGNLYTFDSGLVPVPLVLLQKTGGNTRIRTFANAKRVFHVGQSLYCTTDGAECTTLHDLRENHPDVVLGKWGWWSQGPKAVKNGAVIVRNPMRVSVCDVVTGTPLLSFETSPPTSSVSFL
ncbi:hypothetical protein Pelo_16578 [Pelomyxa schiedti]|nr:hypothetical protein Pelo_16578 [Pelomyxa schiedti]